MEDKKKDIIYRFWESLAYTMQFAVLESLVEQAGRNATDLSILGNIIFKKPVKYSIEPYNHSMVEALRDVQEKRRIKYQNIVS